jgi:hypothetical protein
VIADMTKEPKKDGGPMGAVLAVTLLMPAAYVGGYFGMSEYDGMSREFATARQVEFFWPGLWIENRCRPWPLFVVWSVEGHSNKWCYSFD